MTYAVSEHQIWKHWTKIPTDGSWIHVVMTVDCRECQSEEEYYIAHFIDGVWVDAGDNTPLETGRQQVFKWINIELLK